MEVGSILIILLAINFLLINLFFHLAVRWKIVDTPNERSSHKDITIRGGGIIFPLAWLQYSVWNGFAEPFISLAVLLVAVISFVDDFKPQRPLVRLLFHVTAFLLVFHQLFLIESFGIIALIPVLILCIGILNAVNFMDGINGITVLYFGVYLASIWLLIQETTGHEIPWWSLESPFVYLFASLAVFAFYNLRRKAKTFAGDVGSVSVGILMIVFLLSFGMNRQDPRASLDQVFNWQMIFFLAIYGIDAILTIVQRLIRKENIFKAHRSHLYQLLVNELGMSHLTVAGIYALLQLGLNMYIIYYAPSFMSLVLLTVVLGLFYLLLKSRIKLNKANS